MDQTIATARTPEDTGEVHYGWKLEARAAKPGSEIIDEEWADSLDRMPTRAEFQARTGAATVELTLNRTDLNAEDFTIDSTEVAHEVMGEIPIFHGTGDDVPERFQKEHRRYRLREAAQRAILK